MMNCDHSTTVRHFHSMSKVQKSGVWLPHAQAKTTKTCGLPYVHLCLFVIDWLVNNIGLSYTVSLLVMRNYVFTITYEKERNVCARTRKEYVWNVPISAFITPFSSDHGSTHYPQMTEVQCVGPKLKHNNLFWLEIK